MIKIYLKRLIGQIHSCMIAPILLYTQQHPGLLSSIKKKKKNIFIFTENENIKVNHF